MTYYRIEIDESLTGEWGNWFENWTLNAVERDRTVLCGKVQDQRELHGVLARIRDLRLTILSVQVICDEQG